MNPIFTVIDKALNPNGDVALTINYRGREYSLLVPYYGTGNWKLYTTEGHPVWHTCGEFKQYINLLASIA